MKAKFEAVKRRKQTNARATSPSGCSSANLTSEKQNRILDSLKSAPERRTTKGELWPKESRGNSSPRGVLKGERKFMNILGITIHCRSSALFEVAVASAVAPERNEKKPYEQ